MPLKIPQSDNYAIDLGTFDPNACFQQPAQLEEITGDGVVNWLTPMYCATQAAAQMLAAAVKGQVQGRIVAQMVMSPTIYDVVFPDGSKTMAGYFLYWYLVLKGWTPSGGFQRQSPLTWTAPAAPPATAPAQA